MGTLDNKRAHEILFETDGVRLRYYPVTRIIHHEFRRFVRGPEFRDVLEKGLAAFKQHGACKWLSDDRGNGPVTPADGKWALENWAPRVMAAGWRYWAVVLPDRVLGQMNMKRWIATYAEKGIEAYAFSDPHKALTWLEDVATASGRQP